jgi:hypothetical protein
MAVYPRFGKNNFRGTRLEAVRMDSTGSVGDFPSNGLVPATCMEGELPESTFCVRISLACLRKIARVSGSPKSSEPAEEKTTT